MARFKFRLDKLRRLRRRAEDEAALALAALENSRKRLAACLRDLATRRRNLLDRRQSLSEGSIEPVSLERNLYQIGLLDRKTEAVSREMEDLERRIQAARRILLEKSRERKALDKLEERQLERFEVEEKRRERREADSRPWHGHCVFADENGQG